MGSIPVGSTRKHSHFRGLCFFVKTNDEEKKGTPVRASGLRRHAPSRRKPNVPQTALRSAKKAIIAARRDFPLVYNFFEKIYKKRSL